MHWSKVPSFPLWQSPPQLRGNAALTDSVCVTSSLRQFMLPGHNNMAKTILLLCKQGKDTRTPGKYKWLSS